MLEMEMNPTYLWGILVMLKIWFFLNWDSVHARLNSQYEAQSYNKNKQKKISSIQEICLERTYF